MLILKPKAVVIASTAVWQTFVVCRSLLSCFSLPKEHSLQNQPANTHRQKLVHM